MSMKRRKLGTPVSETDLSGVRVKEEPEVEEEEEDDEATDLGYDMDADGSMKDALLDLQRGGQGGGDDRSTPMTPVNEWQELERSPPPPAARTEADEFFEGADTLPAGAMDEEEEEYNLPASWDSLGIPAAQKRGSDSGPQQQQAGVALSESDMLDFSLVDDEEDDGDGDGEEDTDLIAENDSEQNYYIHDPDIHGFAADPWKRLSFRLRRLFRDKGAARFKIKMHVNDTDDIPFAYTLDLGDGTRSSKRTEFVFSVLASGVGHGMEDEQVEDRNSLNYTAERIFHQWFQTTSGLGGSHIPNGKRYTDNAIVLLADLGEGREAIAGDSHWIILVRQVTRVTTGPRDSRIKLYNVKWSIIDTLTEPHADYFPGRVETPVPSADRMADLADNMVTALEHRIANVIKRDDLPHKLKLQRNTTAQPSSDGFSVLHRISIIPEEMRQERWLWRSVHRRITLGALVRLRNAWSVDSNRAMPEVFPQPPMYPVRYPYHLNGFKLCRTDALEPLRDHYDAVVRWRVGDQPIPRSVLWYPEGGARGKEVGLGKHSIRPHLMRVPLRLRDLGDRVDSTSDFKTDTLGSEISGAELYLQDAMDYQRFIHPSRTTYV